MGWQRSRLMLALALAACGSTESDESASARAAEAPATVAAEEPDPLFDAEGNLLESDERVAGMVLPRGFEDMGTDRPRQHDYSGVDVEIDALVAYLGVRLVTGAVDRIGGGAVFRDALPRGVRGGEVRLDVTAMPSRRGGSRLQVIELPPATSAAVGTLDPARVRTAEQALQAYD